MGGSGNATTVVLVLTELLGFYTISTLLLLRRNLPLKCVQQRGGLVALCAPAAAQLQQGWEMLGRSA